MARIAIPQGQTVGAMRTRGRIVTGCLLCVTAAVWRFAVSPAWEERLPSDWTWESNFIGITNYADADGNYSATDESAEYERYYRIIALDDRPHAVHMEQRVSNRDIRTREVTWESSLLTPVDPRTGAYVGEDHADAIVVFPRHTEKIEYSLHFGYLKDIPMSFEREEEIAGTATYLFHYKGRGEYTESYVGTEDYEGIEVEPGQEIKCNDDQFIVNAWVEPTTGEVVKWDESCYSGDAVYDTATGKKIYEVVRWGGVSRGEDSVTRAQLLRWNRLELLAMTRYIPALLLLLGLGALFVGVFSLRRRQGARDTG